MSFAIIRGSNGRRHEVDFKDDPVAVDVSMSESVARNRHEAFRTLRPLLNKYDLEHLV